jgi:Protein of unknown function (DUF2958)
MAHYQSGTGFRELTRDGNATWLLTELAPDIDLAFGLCDLGLGEPELGYVSLHECAAARGPLGLPLECDLHFAPTRTIAAYSELAREHRPVTRAQLGTLRRILSSPVSTSAQ